MNKKTKYNKISSNKNVHYNRRDQAVLIAGQREAERNQEISYIFETDDEQRKAQRQYNRLDSISFCEQNGTKIVALMLGLMTIGAATGAYLWYANKGANIPPKNPDDNIKSGNKTSSCSLDENIGHKNQTSAVRNTRDAYDEQRVNIKDAVTNALIKGYDGRPLNKADGEGNQKVQNAHQIGTMISSFQSKYPLIVGAKTTDGQNNPQLKALINQVIEDPCLLYSTPEEMAKIKEYAESEVKYESDRNSYLGEMIKVNEEAGCKSSIAHNSMEGPNMSDGGGIYETKEQAEKFAPSGQHRIIKGDWNKGTQRFLKTEKITISAPNRPKSANLALEAGGLMYNRFQCSKYYHHGAIIAPNNENGFPIETEFKTAKITLGVNTKLKEACRETVCSGGERGVQSKLPWYNRHWFAPNCDPTPENEKSCQPPSFKKVFDDMKWCDKQNHGGNRNCTTKIRRGSF